MLTVDVADVVGATRLPVAVLAEPERQRAGRYRFARDRDEFVVGRLGLRVLLGGRLGVDPAAVELETGPAGAPDLRGPGVPPVRFSVSHSGGVVGYALWVSGEAGLDIEAVTAVDAGLADVILTPAERAGIAATPAAQRSAVLLRHWTAKEAYLKATRVGLQRDPRSFDAGAGAVPSGSREEIVVDGVRWAVHRPDVGPGHEAALVTDDLTASVCVRPSTDAMMAALTELAGTAARRGREERR